MPSFEHSKIRIPSLSDNKQQWLICLLELWERKLVQSQSPDAVPGLLQLYSCFFNVDFLMGSRLPSPFVTAVSPLQLLGLKSQQKRSKGINAAKFFTDSIKKKIPTSGTIKGKTRFWL